MFLNYAELQKTRNKIKDHVLDTLFPLHCLGCNKKGQWLCQPCRSDLPRRTHQSCPICLARTTPYGQVCFACKEKSETALDGIFVASFYQVPLLKYIIHSYKYRFLFSLASTIGDILIEELRKSDIPIPDLILPVPLHQRRLRFRGFNQSELLANHLAQALTPGITLSQQKNTLLRTRYTRPQMKTSSKEERIKNLKGAFALGERDTSNLSDKDIWLVDDVATTGTTLEECTTILKQAGAKSVFGIVIAR